MSERNRPAVAPLLAADRGIENRLRVAETVLDGGAALRIVQSVEPPASQQFEQPATLGLRGVAVQMGEAQLEEAPRVVKVPEVPVDEVSRVDRGRRAALALGERDERDLLAPRADALEVTVLIAEQHSRVEAGRGGGQPDHSGGPRRRLPFPARPDQEVLPGPDPGHLGPRWTMLLSIASMPAIDQ